MRDRRKRGKEKERKNVFGRALRQRRQRGMPGDFLEDNGTGKRKIKNIARRDSARVGGRGVGGGGWLNTNKELAVIDRANSLPQ